jgi:hypothetical protein
MERSVAAQLAKHGQEYLDSSKARRSLARIVSFVRGLAPETFDTVAGAANAVLGPENPPVHAAMNLMNRADPMNAMGVAMPIAYHVAPATRLAAIAKEGLKPGGASTVGRGGVAGHSKGRLFLTEDDGVRFWKGKVEDHLFDQFDDPPPAVVIKADKRGTLLKDPVGTQDAKAQAFFTGDTIPPERLQVKGDDGAWLALQEYLRSREPKP